MKQQFIIVNNGMTELRGHYFETAVSIAEAARDAGWQPVLAVHKVCPISAIPTWLRCLPIFRTDHWGNVCDLAPLSLGGIRGNRRAMLDVPIAAVERTAATVTDYLLARFEQLPVRSWSESLKRLIERALPPIVLDRLRWLWRHRGRAKAILREIGRQPLPAFLYDFVRHAYCGLKRGLRGRPPANEGFGPGAIEATLTARMVGEFRQRDLAFARAFRQDLENLLCLIDVGAGDHVFMPTAHYREAFAIRQLIVDIGAECSPNFHLEFRHDVAVAGADLDEANDFISGYTKLGQVYVDAVRGYPDTNRLHFWTDTEELARDYQFHFGYAFGVLPIPFTHDLVAPANAPVAPPLNCLYIGDVREEKGFHRIPGLMRSLAEVGALGTKVRFLIQATDIHPSAATPAVRAAMSELEVALPAHVELVGRGQRFLPRADYYQLLARSDIVLCLYDAKIYRACSSGILAEALAAGKSVVVPADTWLARQLPAGCGESFVDAESLTATVVRIANNYDAYRGRVNERRSAWLSIHSPAALVKRLIEARPDQDLKAQRRAA
jgi:hypothetical protein